MYHCFCSIKGRGALLLLFPTCPLLLPTCPPPPFPIPPPPPSMPPSYGSVIHSWHFVGINDPGQFLSSDLVMKSNVITKDWRSRKRIRGRKGKHEKLPCKSQLMHSLFTCLSISKNTGIVTLKGILQNICTKTLVNFFLAWYMKQKQKNNQCITINKLPTLQEQVVKQWHFDSQHTPWRLTFTCSFD